MYRHTLTIIGLLAAAPVTTQIRDDQDRDAYPAGQEQLPPSSAATAPTRAGRTTDTGRGEVGQRQTREEAAPNIEPTGRINSRIANRVQNRIRSRLDRDYDPRANATSPFSVAGEEARTTRRRTSR